MQLCSGTAACLRAVLIWVSVFVANVALASRQPGLLRATVPVAWEEPRNLKIYIVDDIPVGFSSGRTRKSVEDHSLDPTASELPVALQLGSDETFDKTQAASVHTWIVAQLRASPLRTFEEAEADMFVIPTFFPPTDVLLQVVTQPSSSLSA